MVLMILNKITFAQSSIYKNRRCTHLIDDSMTSYVLQTRLFGMRLIVLFILGNRIFWGDLLLWVCIQARKEPSRVVHWDLGSLEIRFLLQTSGRKTYAISINVAFKISAKKAREGFEPSIFCLRDRRLATWPPRHRVTSFQLSYSFNISLFTDMISQCVALSCELLREHGSKSYKRD